MQCEVAHCGSGGLPRPGGSGFPLSAAIPALAKHYLARATKRGIMQLGIFIPAQAEIIAIEHNPEDISLSVPVTLYGFPARPFTKTILVMATLLRNGRNSPCRQNLGIRRPQVILTSLPLQASGHEKWPIGLTFRTWVPRLLSTLCVTSNLQVH